MPLTVPNQMHDADVAASQAWPIVRASEHRHSPLQWCLIGLAVVVVALGSSPVAQETDS